MDKVKIYIEASTTGTGRHKRAAGMYTIEYIRKNKEAVTCQGLLMREEITGEALVLETISGAFKRLTKICECLVITKHSGILNTVRGHRLPVWEKNGWKKPGGRPPKNMELWQKVHEAMGIHTVSFEDRDPDYTGPKSHSYEECMQTGLRTALDACRKGRKYHPAEKYRKESLEGGGRWMTWRDGE